MDFRDKLNFVKDFFKGKDPNVNPIHYMPVKVFIRFSDNPDCYFDQEDRSKSYTPDEIAELKKKYYLVIMNIVKPKVSELADEHLENLEPGINE